MPGLKERFQLLRTHCLCICGSGSCWEDGEEARCHQGSQARCRGDGFNSDLHNIRTIANIARRLNIPGSGNMLEVVQETTPVILAEVDFRGGGAPHDGLSSFPERRARGSRPQGAHVASPSYIVMEHVPGIKINDTHTTSSSGL